jgi:membrane protease YdiL (CAAX protease family)
VPFLGLVTLVLLTVLLLAKQSSTLLRRPTEGGAAAASSPPRVTPTEECLEDSTAETPDNHSLKRPGGPALSARVLLANVALTQGLVAGVLGVGLVVFEIPLAAIGLTADPWVSGLPAILAGLVLGSALWFLSEAAGLVADAAGFGYDEMLRELLAPSSTEGWGALFGVVLPTIAVAEELLFRAALIGVPATGLEISPWLLAVASSVAFALGHGAQGRVGILATGVLGLVLAAAFVLTGSLLVVVLAHYAMNALEFGVHEGLGMDVT